jgi:hypothetical protein
MESWETRLNVELNELQLKLDANELRSSGDLQDRQRVAKEVSDLYNFQQETFRSWLNGRRPNKSSFIYA